MTAEIIEFAIKGMQLHLTRLEQARDQLRAELGLQSVAVAVEVAAPAPEATAPRTKGIMSAAARRKLSAAMKASWRRRQGEQKAS